MDDEQDAFLPARSIAWPGTDREAAPGPGLPEVTTHRTNQVRPAWRKRLVRAPSSFHAVAHIQVGKQSPTGGVSELGGWAKAQSGVQPFDIVDFAPGNAGSNAVLLPDIRYSCRYTSSYFSVFMNDSQAALS